jgi:predicted nucleic acid-binding Zn ribbon protein
MQQGNLNIDLREQPSVICEKCGGDLFEEVSYIKKVSKLLTGTSQDTVVPFPTYRCTECKHMNEEFKIFDKNDKKDSTLF